MPVKHIEANPDAKRLYDDLLSNYNRLIRPVNNNTETLTVWLGLKLSQLMEVNLKNQVMTTNLWVEQVNSSAVDIINFRGYRTLSRSCYEIYLCSWRSVYFQSLDYFHFRNGSITS